MAGSAPTRYLVTGASGFLAGHVLAELARAGLPCRAVARQPVEAWKMPPPPQVTAQVIPDYAALRCTADEVLIHAGETALNSTAPEEEDHAATALASQPWRAMIYISSAVVYGDRALHDRREDEPTEPLTPYARNKVRREQIVLTHGGTVLRLANLYGLHMSRENVLSSILSQLRPAEPGPVSLLSLEPVRDYLWVGDAAAGISAVARSSQAGIFNMGSGVGTSVRELVETVLREAGISGRDIIGRQPPRTEPSRIVLDSSRLATSLGWRPQFDLARGIRRLLSEYGYD